MIRKHAKSFERLAVVVMAGGILMVWQPWVHALFRFGFPIILIGIAMFVIASHMVVGEDQHE